MTAPGRAILLGAAALVLEVVLRTTAPGAPVWEARGRLHLERGEVDRAEAALERAVRLAPGDDVGLALARIYGAPGISRAVELARGLTASPDPSVQARAWHTLAALHLEEAAASSGPAALQARSRAADAAREALRLQPGQDGSRWNLHLALAGGTEGGGEPGGAGGESRRSGAGSNLDPRTARSIQAALAQVEARSLRESLAAILAEVEARTPSAVDDSGTGGPPW